MFKKAYIDALQRIDNAFGEWGTWGHKIFEQYYSGKLELFELCDTYESDYNKNVKTRFPPNAHVDLNKSYYKAGKEYFSTFEDDFEAYKILAIEQEIKLKIQKYSFIGYIDLVLQDKDGNIIIVDHKSKAKFKNKKEKGEYLRQLYLYSQYIYENYGKYPTKLVFNMFRTREIVEEEFKIDDLNAATEWFVDTIEKIYADMEFEPVVSDYFCNFICSVRCWCPNSNGYLDIEK